MLIRHIIILLLSWRVTSGVEDDNGQITDQIAAESNAEIIENPGGSSTRHPPKETWTTSYENSNGFVPMLDVTSKNSQIEKNEDTSKNENFLDEISKNDRAPSENLKNDDAVDVRDKINDFGSDSLKDDVDEAEKDRPEGEKVENDSWKSVENDPAYSTEARMFLNLGSPISNRRSYEARNDESEFEILKVTKETPAVADYREFYENLKRNRAETDAKEEKSAIGKSKRSRGVDKSIGSRDEDRQRSSSVYERHYENYPTGSPQIWENYPSESLRDFQTASQRNAMKIQKTTFEPSKTWNRDTYEDSDSRDRQNSRKIIDDDSRYAKKNRQPVVVVEPTDFRIDLNYNNRQTKINSKTIRNDYPEVRENGREEAENRFEEDVNREDRYGSYEDYSEDYTTTQKPHRAQKFRSKRPVDENSRKLVKEHRAEETRPKASTRSKFHRTRPWVDDNRDESEENSNSGDNPGENLHPRENSEPGENSSGKSVSTRSRVKTKNWSQIGPNVEISHSKGVEIEKPKILVPVNILPLTNFDHGAAIGNSQGFDLSNVPLLSTSSSILDSSQIQQKNVRNAFTNDYRFSTQVPEIIVGQNSYQNGVQAVLLPQISKFQNRPQFASTTMSPVFTIAQNPIGGPTTVAPTIVPAVSQFLIPQSTLGTYPILQQNQNLRQNQNQHQNQHLNQNTQQILDQHLHHNLNPNSHYNILVNPNGLHGQNFIGTNQNLPILTTTPNPSYETAESQLKTVASQFVTGASLSVSNQNKPDKNNNGNHYSNNQNNGNNYSNVNGYQGTNNVNQKVGENGQKTLIHPQIVPAIIHPGISMNLAANYHQDPSHLLGAQKSGDILENTWKQLQQLRMNDEARRYHVFRVNDNIISTTNSNANVIGPISNLSPVGGVKAHLPILGPQNVEIVNPNIKPSPVDPISVSPFGTLNSIGSYQTAILTTPIPIFTTQGNFYAGNQQNPHQHVQHYHNNNVQSNQNNNFPNGQNLQNYVDQLTQIGATGKNEQKTNREVFNPINFVPNVDLMKSQTILNSKNAESLPNRLSLVPVLPGGNFFKNSPNAQLELIQKPKLSNDLEKYAEEMLKESLKTIYSTHKWNNDRKIRGNYTPTELNDYFRMKSDLQRLKAMSLLPIDPTSKDVLEAHNSETNVRTVEHTGSKPHRPELTIADIEQLFKSDSKYPVSTDFTKNRQVSGEFGNVKELIDYLTPPKINSFVSKSPFVDTKPKKRPASGSRFTGSSSRHGSRPISDTAASNHVETIRFSDKRNRYDKTRNYPTFTTSSPEDNFRIGSDNDKYSKNDFYDINHPRMHNLLGLLMKNKQLPVGSSQSHLTNEPELRRYFDNERRKPVTHLFNEMNAQKRSDTPINMAPPKPPILSKVRAPILQT